MILIDFSSIVHRMIHSAISDAKPKQNNGKYVTLEFIGLTKYYILQELFNIKQEHSGKFGELVVCLDKSDNGYWRNDIFPGYKALRKSSREESEINYDEVFAEIDLLIDQIRSNLPIKVVEVQRAEADDIMLVLAKEFNKYEKIMIHSPDKDMIQAQRDTDNVFQYSALTKKWIVAENKHDNIEHWITEHVCLGDASDGVPKITDHTVFSDAFIQYLKQQGYELHTPMEFRAASIDAEEKKRLIVEFDVYKTNRKGESTGEKYIYEDPKIGPATLVKKLAEHGSLDAWLDSHPMYRSHYERNYTLVMSEGIPSEIWNNIVLSYKTAETKYNDREFAEYLKNNNLQSILMTLPSVFKITRSISADDFGW